MRHYLLLSFFFFFLVWGSGFSQTIEYNTILGGRNLDEGRASAVDSKGNVYVAGKFSGSVDFDSGPGERILTAITDTLGTLGLDAFLMKLNAAGDLLWVKGLGSESLDFIASVAVNSKDEVYVLGEFGGEAFEVYPSGTLNIEFEGSDEFASTEDVFLIQFDADGNAQGGRSFEAAASDMAIDSEDNVIITGTFRDTLAINSLGTTIWESNGQKDVYLLKFSAEWLLQWGKTFGGEQNEDVVALALDPRDNINLAGNFSGTVSFDPDRAGFGTKTTISENAPDVFVQTIGSTGLYVGTTTYGSEGFDNVEDIVVDKDFNVYLVGSFVRATTFDPITGVTLTPTTPGRNDSYLLKLYEGTRFGWVEAYGTEGGDRLYSLATDEAGAIYATGTYAGTLSVDVEDEVVELVPEGSTDVFTLKIAPQGTAFLTGPTVSWANSLGNELVDYPQSIAVGSNGDVVLTGVTRFSSDTEPENNDIFIAKINQPTESDSLAEVTEGETIYYVTTTGQDTDSRDGLSPATAWKTLSYACEQVPAGDNTIKLGSGTFVESQTATPKSGVSIVGNGSEGQEATIVQASADWTVTGSPLDFNYTNYIIGVNTFAMKPGSTQLTTNLTIRDIKFSSAQDNLIDGAIFIRDAQDILIEDLHIEDFRWTAIRLAFDSNIEVRNCTLVNVNGEDVFGDTSGDIFTRWVKNAEFHDITFLNTIEGERVWGVGYKGSGHEDTKIYSCSFMNDGGGFDIEIPHENEYGVEIFDCQFDSPISIPREGNGDDPNTRGFEYSFWIHDNYMTNSYVIEGPRNHLRVNDNFIDIKNPGGRVYSQFGGESRGPMWIYNNVIRNVDMAFIWKREGRLDSVYIYNNTVYLADAEDRAGAIIDSYGNMAGWEIKNNVFIAPDSQPRRLGSAADCSYCGEITFTNNLLVNVFTQENEAIPEGNYTDQDPGFFLSGEKPSPFYRPAASESFVVDKGVDVGFDFEGSAPDLGAYEYVPSEEPPADPTSITIRAKGSTGEEIVELWEGDQRIGSSQTLTTEWAAVEWSLSSLPANLKVQFANDGRTADDRDKNVRVDYLVVGRDTLQAEAQAINTGVHEGGNCGGDYSEWLHCQGYIDFGNLRTTASAAAASVENKFRGSINQTTVFPNPVGEEGLNIRLAEEEQVTRLTIIDTQGSIVRTDEYRFEGLLQVPSSHFPRSGVYLVRIDNGASHKTFRVMVEK